MFWCLGVFSIALVWAWLEHEWLLGVLAAPLPKSAPQPITLSVAEPFLTSLKVSMLAAFCCAIPVVYWHGFSFLAPVVERAQRRSAAVLALLSAVLFAAGIAFGYLVALPQSLAFLVGFGADTFDVQLRAGELYRFNAIVILACGVVFQLPIVVIGLVRFRIVTADQLRGNRRIGWAMVAALAVCMPGVDPVLTSITFVPLVLMYEVTLLVATRLERRWGTGRSGEEATNSKHASRDSVAGEGPSRHAA